MNPPPPIIILNWLIHAPCFGFNILCRIGVLTIGFCLIILSAPCAPFGPTLNEWRAQLQSATTDSSRARIKAALAWELRHIDSRESLQLAEQVIEYGYKHNDVLRLTEAFRARATCLVVQKKLLPALQSYDSCMKYARVAKSAFYQASCYSLMAGMYGDLGDYNQAIEYYTLGLEQAKMANSNYILSVLSNNLADAYQYSNRNTQLVQENLRLAIRSALADDDFWGAAMSASNLAREFANNSQYDSMEKYMDQASIIFQKPDLKPYHRGSVYAEFAAIYLILKKPAEAIPFAQNAIKVLDSLNRVDNVLPPMAHLMKAHYALNHFAEAESAARDLLRLSQKQKAKLYIRDAYKTLSDIARRKNDYALALEFYEAYKAWNDSIFSVAKEQSIANNELKLALSQKEFEARYSARQKAAENKLLIQENNALSLKIWLALIFGLVLMAFSLLLFQAYRKKKKINQQLRQEKSRVEQQAREKMLLIGELHHRVKNNLTMLKSLLFLQARISTNEDTKRILEESQARINSMALVHKNLYDDNENGQLNFPIFLESLLSELAASYIDSSRDLELLVEGHCEDLNIELAIPLALMMNELATNSFKYAFQNNGQHLIRIKIEQEDRHLKIRYADNGPGIEGSFDLSKGGFGFRVLSILSQQINAHVSYHKSSDESVFLIELTLTPTSHFGK